MSLAARGSRAITVDGDAYRWAVSPDSGYNVIVVQAAGGSGSKLLVYAAYSTIRYAGANEDGLLMVTPALVTSVIRQARGHGWQPGETGADIVCDLQADEAIAPRASGP